MSADFNVSALLRSLADDAAGKMKPMRLLSVKKDEVRLETALGSVVLRYHGYEIWNIVPEWRTWISQCTLEGALRSLWRNHVEFLEQWYMKGDNDGQTV